MCLIGPDGMAGPDVVIFPQRDTRPVETKTAAYLKQVREDVITRRAKAKKA